MKQLFVGKLLLLLLYIPFSSTAQTSIGIEAGFNFTGYISLPNETFFIHSLHPGLDAVFFVENHIKKKIALRTSLLYSMRFFYGHARTSSASYPYTALNCITLPLLASFKTDSKFSFDIGLEFIAIIPPNIAPDFIVQTIHLGPKAAIVYQINPTFSLRFYGFYDLIKIREAPPAFDYYNNISFGSKLAYTFKRIKKRRVIRGAG